ncbi:MAG: zinc-ribbon domain-containing protein [Clostridiales bacterium]|nr:zinc-ribbon domain-containing protein [Clostridiales bacterium]
MYCGSCGRPIADDARFCMFCGWQVVVPQQAVQQPMQQAAPQAVPQVQPQVQPQAVPQVQPQAMPVQQPIQQAVPMQQPAQMPMGMGAGTIMEPICVTLITPKNAQKEKLKLESAAMYYIEINNNTLIISGKGGAASYMFGAVGAIVTAAACDLKPVLMIAPNQIRNMTYEKKFGDILSLELFDGKLLQIKSKMEVLNTVENWWRSQLV